MRLFLSITISILLFGCQAQQQDGAGEAGNTGRESSQEVQLKPFEDVNAAQAGKMVESGDFVILDVRTDREFQSGHIEGAQQLDFYDERFADKLAELPKDKSYLVYCASGNRSGQALRLMEELQFQEAHNLKGGIAAWRSKSLKTVK